MSRSEIIAFLRNYKIQTAGQYGIQELGIFGSVARDEATTESDVDVVVKLDPPNLLIMSRIRQEIEDALHMPVDIVHYRDRMNAAFKTRIDSEVFYV